MDKNTFEALSLFINGIIILIILIILFFNDTTHGQPTITPEKWNETYRPNYFVATDSTILNVEYITTDFLGKENIEMIYCKKLNKNGNIYYYYTHDGSRYIITPGDFKYKIKVTIVKKE